MDERFKILAAMARSLGVECMTIGISAEVTAALVAAGGRSTIDTFPANGYYPEPYAIDSAELVIDGVRLRCQADSRPLTAAEAATLEPAQTQAVAS